MAMIDCGFMRSLMRLCCDGWFMGWHERNAGNVSYLLDDDEMKAASPFLKTKGACHEWQALDIATEMLAGRLLAVTGAGQLFRNSADAPEQTFGVVEFDTQGRRYRVLWGLEGGRPTSEFPTHVIAHEARQRATRGEDRVVYHAHCPSTIALSNILEPNSRTWTRALWHTMTECVLFFPDGVGVVPWMVPGGSQIAEASGTLLQSYPACVWTQHGLFSTGDSCDAAFGLAHMVEKTAGIYLQARAACGGQEPPYQVSDDQLRRICSESSVVPNADMLD